jgi:dihydroneopterin aldolase
MLRNLILKWSALVDDLGPFAEIIAPTFRDFGKPELVLEEFRTRFRSPRDSVYREQLPEIELAADFAERARNLVLLPHALAFLQFCRDSGRRLFLLSDAPETQLARFGIAGFFSEIHSGIFDKGARIGEILAAQNLRAHETAFIGDTARDVEAAWRGGVTSIVVLTGDDSAATVSRARPDVVVRDLSELQTLLENVSPNDEILIEDLELFARLGVPDEERSAAQRLTISLRLELRHGFGALDDELARTVDYAAVCAELRDFVQTREDHLLETLADVMAEHLLARFDLARVTLELRKFILPETKYVAAKVTRAAAPSA